MPLEHTEAGKATDGGGKSHLSLGAILTASGGVLLVAFMLQNREDVVFDFLWWSVTGPLWLIILFSAVFGALVWLGLGMMRRHRRRKQRRADRHG